MTKIRTLTARDITHLLEIKHSKDVFVPECKDGPTHGGPHRRIDAWAMAKSWSRPRVTGYEIKVSRSDFLKDEKWPDYLAMCNCLYFVCPYGLIQPEEMSDNVGLMWVAKTGTRIYTKRKAVYRDVEIPESVYRYILMCRTQITREHVYGRDQRAEQWADWAKRRTEMKNLGHRVSTKILDYIEFVRRENREVREENEALSMFRDRLIELGFDPEKRVSTWGIRDKINLLLTGIPRGLEYELENVARDAQRALEHLREIKEASAPGEKIYDFIGE